MHRESLTPPAGNEWMNANGGAGANEFAKYAEDHGKDRVWTENESADLHAMCLVRNKIANACIVAGW